MMSIKKKTVSLMLMVFFVMGGVAYAQQQQMQQQQQPQKEYSAEEIDLFAEAVATALPVQQESEQKMIAEIEKQGMELDEFNQIAQQMQQGAQPEGLSDEKMETFQSISEEIQAINMETQKKVNEIITEVGISPAMYQEMISAYSTNAEIKQKVDQKLAEQQQQ